MIPARSFNFLSHNLSHNLLHNHVQFKPFDPLRSYSFINLSNLNVCDIFSSTPKRLYSTFTSGLFNSTDTTPRSDQDTKSSIPTQKSSQNTQSLMNDGPVFRKKITTKEESFANLLWKMTGGLIFAGLAMTGYYQYQKKVYTAQAQAKMERGIGNAAIGGDWVLIDHYGMPRSNTEFLGKYVLYYFGFTMCPDICPTELEKVSDFLNTVKKNHPDIYKDIATVFITLDPARDSVGLLREYIKEFHPDILALTGTPYMVDRIAKVFRVFHYQIFEAEDYAPSEPRKAQGERDAEDIDYSLDLVPDYLVDHSTWTTLMDRNGNYAQLFATDDDSDLMYEKFMKIYREDEILRNPPWILRFISGDSQLKQMYLDVQAAVDTKRKPSRF